MYKVQIYGTGLYTPKEKISNEELVQSFNKYVDEFNELADKYSFGVGASISSFLFFFILGYLSKFSSNYLKNPRIWKIINNFIILFMGGIALFVLREIINYY